MGLGSLAVKEAIKICKNKYKLKKITAGCYEVNKGSIKNIKKKNNFKKEAVLNSHILFENKRIKQFIFGLKI